MPEYSQMMDFDVVLGEKIFTHELCPRGITDNGTYMYLNRTEILGVQVYVEL